MTFLDLYLHIAGKKLYNQQGQRHLTLTVKNLGGKIIRHFS